MELLLTLSTLPRKTPEVQCKCNGTENYNQFSLENKIACLKTSVILHFLFHNIFVLEIWYYCVVNINEKL